ncbi:MAG TPA: peptidoglycan-binding protein [Streptomyces sp.]|uniref:peptidoglycan-binding protein n=1 Tax=Streptomyces sp. TaxID=1931 RepID=UPI002B6AE5E6|nr:peptidoglycan-binding protein [Streptomyces sp.]HWU07998.1 peptidoglycan-binding protein [Streptomyces sp.]
MTVPVFEEYEPAADCGCPGCARHRRTDAERPVRHGGHPAAHGARRALVLVTAAGMALSCGAGQAAAYGARDARADNTVADPQPDTPQGPAGPLYDGGGSEPPPAPDTASRTTTRAEIIKRAQAWVTAKVPYDMAAYWRDGYRQDCSGFVSMAWGLGTNEWTGSLARFGTKIARADLEPGDILLFHNPADPAVGSHVTVFGGWIGGTRSHYRAYELTRPRARKATTPMAYWSNSSKYVAYRYKGLVSGAGGSGAATAFPGAAAFGPGTDNAYVTRLGELLIAQGGGRFYRVGAGPRWSDADRRATRAFQLAQGWRGGDADGLPGPDTWNLLVTGTGHAIPAASGGAGAYPGRGYFQPGRVGSHVERLGVRLVEKGYGAHYATGPGPRWTEADRRNVEAFQRAQGWSGSAADGYPGPETWRRLFA